MKSCLASALFNPHTMVLSTTGWPGSGFLLRPLLFFASLLSLLLQPRSASFQSDQLLLLLPLTHSLTHFNPPNTTIHHLLKTSSLASPPSNVATSTAKRSLFHSPPAATTPSPSLLAHPTPPPPFSSTWTPAATSSGSPAPPSSASSVRAKKHPLPPHLLRHRPSPAPISSLAASPPVPPPTPTLPPSTSAPSPAAPSMPSRPPPHAPPTHTPTSTMPTRMVTSSPTSTVAPLSVRPLRLPNFTFAYAHSMLVEPVDVIGFDRSDLLSLPSQLTAFSPFLITRFSYYLVSHSFHLDHLLYLSPLIFGRSLPTVGQTEPDSRFIYTPLLPNPKHPYLYSVALLALSINPTCILAQPNLSTVDRNGKGGMVVDSGTTFTMLPVETMVVDFGPKPPWRH